MEAKSHLRVLARLWTRFTRPVHIDQGNPQSKRRREATARRKLEGGIWDEIVKSKWLVGTRREEARVCEMWGCGAAHCCFTTVWEGKQEIERRKTVTFGFLFSFQVQHFFSSARGGGDFMLRGCWIILLLLLLFLLPFHVWCLLVLLLFLLVLSLLLLLLLLHYHVASVASVIVAEDATVIS